MMTAGSFEIVVRGTLGPAFTAVFDDFTVSEASVGKSRLVGWVPDQARLQGALTMLWDLGMEVMSVSRISSTSGHEDDSS